MSAPCGHPLAARAVRVRKGVAVTGCWACDVERELYDRSAGARGEQKWREPLRLPRKETVA